MALSRVLPMLLLSGLAAATVAPMGAGAVDAKAARGGWTVEQGTAEPTYAVADVARTTLNVEEVVLSCEAGDSHRLLQLQLQMTEEGALRPTNVAQTVAMKDDPKAVVTIDGREFPVDLLFADNYVVLADAQDGRMPMLSPALADAMQTGRTMTVRVDLLAKPAGAPAMDGEAVVNLQAPGGREAIAAVRRCAAAGSGDLAEARGRQ